MAKAYTTLNNNFSAAQTFQAAIDAQIGITNSTGNLVLDASTGVISANVNKISSVVDPTSNQDAATKAYVDTHGDNLGNHTATEDLNMRGYDINNVDRLEVNYISDYDEGYVFCADDFELDDAEQIRSDTANLVIVGGTDPVVIGGVSIGGSSDDLYVYGNLDVNGDKNCIVQAKDGKKYIFSAIESPEVWFEEKLSGVIINGKCEIVLDNRFLASTVIDKENPIHINISPTSEGTAWVEKFTNKVIVHGNCSTFDLTISAKRLGRENKRFDEIIKDEETGEEYKMSKEEEYLRKKPIKQEIRNIKQEIKQNIINKKGLLKTGKKSPEFDSSLNDINQNIKNKKILIQNLREQANGVNNNKL